MARRVNPPDPDGDVGPNHYVEMVNLTFAVYSKTGTRLLGPVDLGALWAGFAIEDCTDESGDAIVLYDQTTDRWLLTQFTTRGLNQATPTAPFYNCVAVSQTGDPTGAYYRYAFITQPDAEDGGYFFPDYPKYGVWRDSYIMTTRDFGFDDRYGISVYGLEKNKMVNGEPGARAVQFFLEDHDAAQPDRRRTAAAGHRRQHQTEERRPRADRRHAGRRRWVRRRTSTRSTSGSSTSSGGRRRSPLSR